jgi:hypothetical protein
MNSDRKKLIMEADYAWRQLIRAVFNGRCAVCVSLNLPETDEIPACHHILGRNVAPDARQEPYNGVTLCTLHHIPFAHKKPSEFLEWLKEHLPYQWEWQNNYVPNCRSRFDAEIQDIINDLKDKREQLLKTT